MWKGKQKAKINRQRFVVLGQPCCSESPLQGEFGRPIFQKILRVETDTNNQVGLAARLAHGSSPPLSFLTDFEMPLHVSSLLNEQLSADAVLLLAAHRGLTVLNSEQAGGRSVHRAAASFSDWIAGANQSLRPESPH
jgi:hypothetical protein